MAFFYYYNFGFSQYSVDEFRMREKFFSSRMSYHCEKKSYERGYNSSYDMFAGMINRLMKTQHHDFHYGDADFGALLELY
jgi:hypothetical protein